MFDITALFYHYNLSLCTNNLNHIFPESQLLWEHLSQEEEQADKKLSSLYQPADSTDTQNQAAS